ncbi:MAG: hypothetical protein OXR66_05175 [Candidatus Woesearchaeota archaeon]|nr:hypothetical protein [Candidatus Woesearchaeota archaeon]
MAKGTVQTILDTVTNVVLPSFVSRIEDGVDDILTKVEDRVVGFFERMCGLVTVLILVKFAVFSFLLALFFYLLEGLNLSKATVFLLLGTVFLVLAAFANMYSKIRRLTRR